MRLFHLRFLTLLGCMTLVFTATSQNVLFDIQETVIINCSDSTTPEAIAGLATMGSPVAGTTTSYGTTDCTAAATNQLTFSFTDEEFPRSQCMDELVLITRSWTATDECGSTLTLEQDISVRDDVAPTLVCNTDVTVNASMDGMNTLVQDDLVTTVSDDCEMDVNVTFSQTSFNVCENYTVTVTAEDGCGNMSDCTVNVFVTDSCPTTLACNDQIQVSLGANCTAEVNPNLILEDPVVGCPMQVKIYDHRDVLQSVTDISTLPFTYPELDASNIDERLKAEVLYVDCAGTEISCWGWITVEDKIRPNASCVDDFVVSCKDDLSNLFTSTSTLTYCVDPVDINSDPAVETFALVVSGNGSINPWEIITSSTTSAVVSCTSGIAGGMMGSGTGSGTGSNTGSGTGSGSMGVANLEAEFNVGGVITIDCDDEGNFDFDVLAGALASDLGNNPTISLPAGSLPASGLCFSITTESFGLYNPDNCDSAAEVNIIRDETDQNECGDDGFVALRVIEYVVQDQTGQTSQICDVRINFAAEPLSEIDFPSDFVVNCLDFEGVGTEFTGMPMLGGSPLQEDDFCKLNVSFQDEFLQGDASSMTSCLNFRIRRQWTVLDWCLGEYRQHFQMIRVVDNEAPVCSVFRGDFTISASNGCTTDYIMTPFEEGADSELLLTDCSESSVLRVEYTEFADAFIFDVDSDDILTATPLGNNRFRLNDLAVGQHWVRYVVADGCGNESNSCLVEVTVTNSNPPIAVCDQFTAVSLADNGWGRLFGPSLDDGSYSPCGGDVSLEVRRLSNPCEEALMDRDDTVFGEFVQFCCLEAGQTIPVELRVSDASGMSSVCNVNVIVQDKNSDAAVICPTAEITVNNCNESNPESRFGFPVLSGECAVPAILDTIDRVVMNDDCGVGTLTRTWIIGVNGDEGAVDNCTQTISITGDDGLTVNSFRFPADRTINDCEGFDTDLGEFPTIGGVIVTEADLCARLAFSFDDNPFYNVDGYCAKIIRTWTVINWCIYDPTTNPSEGIFTDTQIIKLNNTTGPIITNCAEDIAVSANTEDCNAFVNIPMPTAEDACFGTTLTSSEIVWSITGSGVNETGEGNGASRELGVGTYTVLWTATGLCSTTSTCSFQVTVSDDQLPTPYCRGVVTTVITSAGSSGIPAAVVSASDFDLGSTDGCGGDLSVSFSADNLGDTTREFNCNQLGFQSVEIWFTDEDGNQDFCISTVNIQVNGDICDTIGSRPVINIEGDIFTEGSQMIEAVPVELMSMTTNEMLTDNTDDNGHFAFDDLNKNEDYRIEAVSTEDYLNGISTLDLVIIQRHILGIDKLDSPYKLIAADINNSQDINGIDLVELRKLILGIYTELPQNNSWRFVEEDFAFTNPVSPWPFDENINLSQVGQDMMENDFIGVKVGDVNGSVVVSLEGDDVVTNRNIYTGLKHDILKLEDDLYLVPVYFDQAEMIYGLQLSLELSPSTQFINIESGKVTIDEAETLYDNGRLDISIARSELQSIQQDEALFYLTFKSQGHIPASLVQVSDSGIKSELYRENYEVVAIQDGAKTLLVEPILYQNVPNPFNGETTIEFDLPESSNVTMSILDINGQLIKSFQGYYELGSHQIEINTSDLTENGVYYYQMETENYTATRKMIRVD